MAVPWYATDLTTLLLDMSSTTGWTALGGGAAGLNAPETDVFIQGSNCIDKSYWTNNTKGMIYNMGGGQTIASGDAVYMWLNYTAPNSLAIEISGGIQVLIGNLTTAFKQWYVKGSDTYAYGGWFCAVVDPTVDANTQTGSPTSTLQYFGAQAYLPTTAGPTKGYPFIIDAFRHGRVINITGGQVSDYATFVGMASTNDTTANRWGIFQAIDGGYLMQGKINLGQAGGAVDFRDSNRNISIANVKKVTAGFNAFEVLNVSSRVDWTNVQIAALGIVSKGTFVATDNATINKDTCVFTDMSTFSYLANSTILNSTYRRCGQITQSGATFTGCVIDKSTATKAMVASDVSVITDTTFISSGTGYGIEGFSTAGNYTLNSITFTGYAAGVSGTSGNEGIHILASSGVVNISINGTGNVPSYHTAGATVYITANQKSIYISNLVSGTEIHVYTTPGLTELTGIESSSTSWTWSYTPDDSSIFITLIKPGYKWIRYDGLTLSSSGISIIATQQADLGYSNPV